MHPLAGRACTALLVVAALVVVAAVLAGWQVEVVLSGSMEPAIPVGGVVVTAPVSPEDVRAGDIITFSSGGHHVTHRVTAVVEGPTAGFITRGDANEDADPVPVAAGDVVGRALFSLPFLGYLAVFVRTPAGFFLTLLVPGLVLVALEVQTLRGKHSEREG
ncbi:signal peptidase I [Methanofollis ethanolicus]|uniref:signal peptidase I n=1 Tax=Methanofollis ethanolicus TaxID=488124 RepID=UPI00082E6430|nr:signal peptidase I [Methanofollis ethanolicus]